MPLFIIAATHCKIQAFVSPIPTIWESSGVPEDPTTVKLRLHTKDVAARQKVRFFVEEEKIVPRSDDCTIRSKSCRSPDAYPRSSRSISDFPLFWACPKFPLRCNIRKQECVPVKRDYLVRPFDLTPNGKSILRVILSYCSHATFCFVCVLWSNHGISYVEIFIENPTTFP